MRHRMGAVEGWVVTHDGETIKSGFTNELEAVKWIHDRHSYSVDHAVKHEGYDIVLVEGGKVAWSYKRDILGRRKGPGLSGPGEFQKDKEFLVAHDLDWPDLPGDIVAVYWADWKSGRPVVEGWRGPAEESEDFARKRLDPYPCQHLMTDIGGFWECLRGTIIGGQELGAASKRPWCLGSGMGGEPLRAHPRLDRCPVCDAVFVKSGRLRIPLHREGVGDVALPRRA